MSEYFRDSWILWLLVGALGAWVISDLRAQTAHFGPASAIKFRRGEDPLGYWAVTGLNWTLTAMLLGVALYGLVKVAGR